MDCFNTSHSTLTMSPSFNILKKKLQIYTSAELNNILNKNQIITRSKIIQLAVNGIRRLTIMSAPTGSTMNMLNLNLNLVLLAIRHLKFILMRTVKFILISQPIALIINLHIFKVTYN